ncbi:MAG: PhoH family protein, partial [Acidobacteriota bacterium]
MKKTFVLDANVLLHDPNCLTRFEDNDIVIPITVIEEIDRFKKELTEVGRNARQVSRYLDRLREAGHLVDGVPSRDGGTIRIDLGRPFPDDFPFLERENSPDMRILNVALALHRDP